MKLKHAEIDLARDSEKDIPVPGCSQKDDSDSGSDWDEDLEVQLEETQKDETPLAETSDLVSGRIYRKSTSPSLVQAPRKVVCRTEVRPESFP